MNIFLWVLQVLLAVHTVMGSVWKFKNGPQTVPSLAVIPQGIWYTMCVFEILCAIALVVPFFARSFAFLVPLAAIGIAIEMLVFCGLQLASGQEHHGEIIYWGVVAVLCAFIAIARFTWIPIQ